MTREKLSPEAEAFKAEFKKWLRTYFSTVPTGEISDAAARLFDAHTAALREELERAVGSESPHFVPTGLKDFKARGFVRERCMNECLVHTDCDAANNAGSPCRHEGSTEGK